MSQLMTLNPALSVGQSRHDIAPVANHCHKSRDRTGEFVLVSHIIYYTSNTTAWFHMQVNVSR